MSEAIWSEVCNGLEREIGKEAFRHWIAPLTFGGERGGVVEIQAPTRFLGQWVERHYARDILTHLRKAGRNVSELRFTWTRERAEGALPASSTGREDAASPAGTASRHARPLPTATLKPQFTFETFVVGKPNMMAHAAARQVAEAAGDNSVVCNPLFLYSGVGLGKTHLMHAIAWELTRNRGKRVIYLSAEQFMYRFVQALRSRDMLAFKEMFRSVDVLMVDDVQFIAGKDSTQEEFFHTFNALIDQGKQVVISADRAPGEIDGIEERIRSRLQWGLVVDIHPADFELRLGILQSKAEAHRARNPEVEIPEEVLEFLARKITDNIRVLEGALTRLVSFAAPLGTPVTIDFARQCLADILRAADRKITLEEIMRKVGEHYGLRISDLVGPRRSRAIARPRQVAMYLAKAMTSKSLPDIGRAFGGRDHTTVLHAVRRIEALRAADARIADDLEYLRRQLES